MNPQELFKAYCTVRFVQPEWRFGRRPTEAEMPGPEWVRQSSYKGLMPPNPEIVAPERTILKGLMARDVLPAAIQVFREAEALERLGIARRAALRPTEERAELDDIRTNCDLEQYLRENRCNLAGASKEESEEIAISGEWREPPGSVGTAVEEIAYRLEVDRSTVDRWLSWDNAVPSEKALQLCRIAESWAFELLRNPPLEKPGARAAFYYYSEVTGAWHTQDGLGPMNIEDSWRRPPEVKVDLGKISEGLGGIQSLARYCRVPHTTVRRWLKGEEAPTNEKQWALMEARSIGKQVAACLGYLKGPQATAIGGTPEARMALEVDLLNFSTGRQTPTGDVFDALDYLLVRFEAKDERFQWARSLKV